MARHCKLRCLHQVAQFEEIGPIYWVSLPASYQRTKLLVSVAKGTSVPPKKKNQNKTVAKGMGAAFQMRKASARVTPPPPFHQKPIQVITALPCR
jgi:hypothetical protein